MVLEKLLVLAGAILRGLASAKLLVVRSQEVRGLRPVLHPWVAHLLALVSVGGRWLLVLLLSPQIGLSALVASIAVDDLGLRPQELL